MAFERVDNEERQSVVWPSGFSARLLDDRAELVDPDGSVLAREGDVISNIGGAAANNGDVLLCFDFATKLLVDHAP